MLGFLRYSAQPGDALLAKTGSSCISQPFRRLIQLLHQCQLSFGCLSSRHSWLRRLLHSRCSCRPPSQRPFCALA